MGEELIKILYLFLGWLIAILSPAIVEGIRNRRHSKEIKVVLQNEMHELQYLLVGIIFQIKDRFGQLDREFLILAKSVYDEYCGIDAEDYKESLLKNVNGLLSIPADQLKVLSDSAMRKKPKGGLTIKKHHLPIFDSNISSLIWINEKLRNQLLEIKRRVSLLNELADEAQSALNLTYQIGITPQNYSNAENNMIGSYTAYSKQAQQVVNLISKIEAKKH